MAERPQQHQQHQPLGPSSLADSDEERAIFSVLDSFRQYRKQTHFGTTHRRRQSFYALPQAHQNLLTAPSISLLDTLSAIDDAIDENADLADDILAVGISAFGLVEASEPDSPKQRWHEKARVLDLDKAHSTIRQFWRDWSEEGYNAEVKPVLELILQDFNAYLNVPVPKSRVLLPGAGLARLPFELCLAGCIAEGNEISYHQLIASNFILNTVQKANRYRLYPFLNSFNNHQNRQNQLHCVTVPDIHPGSYLKQLLENGHPVGQISMTAGDFVTSYSSAESTSSFDSVVTIYFIDTAPNIIRYIETISNCLDQGGIWINIGPLLWHGGGNINNQEENNREKEAASTGTNVNESGSFELTDEETLTLVQSLGFELLSHKFLPLDYGGYIRDDKSMLQHNYLCSHWVMRKR